MSDETSGPRFPCHRCGAFIEGPTCHWRDGKMYHTECLPNTPDRKAVVREVGTSRTDREVYTIRQQDIGFEAVGATLARTLERELAAALAERNTLQLALNAASGRADGLEVALQECRDTFNEYAEIHRAKGESGVSKMLANRALAERCNAALSTTPESPYKQAMREYFEAADKFEHDGPNEGDWDAVETAEQRCRTLLTDPQPDTKGQCNG